MVMKSNDEKIREALEIIVQELLQDPEVRADLVEIGVWDER